MVQKISETLGIVLKNARQSKGLTVEYLAEKAGITERYLYRIENEGKVPSLDVLNRLVHTMSISADLIFYPERPVKESEAEDLIRELNDCNAHSWKIVKAIVEAYLKAESEG